MFRSLRNLFKCKTQGNQVSISSSCCRRQKITLTFNDIDETTAEIVHAVIARNRSGLRLTQSNGRLVLTDEQATPVGRTLRRQDNSRRFPTTV